MKILFTIYSGLGKGGAEVSTNLLAQELKRRGHEVVIASYENYPDVRCIRFNKLGWNYWKNEKYLTKFFSNIIKREKIDIVHAQDRMTSAGAILATRKNNLPVVVHLRDYWFVCPKSSCLTQDYKEYVICNYSTILKNFPIYRWPIDFYKLFYLKHVWKIFKKVDSFLVGDEATVKKLNKIGVNDKIKIVHNARDLSLFRNVKALDKEKYNLRKTVLGFVGTLTYSKGIQNLFKFIPDILKENNDVSFLIAGDGDLEEEIKNKINKGEVKDQIVFLGRVDYNKMPSVFKTIDILLMPTIWTEPYGGVQIDGTASKCAIIGANVGGIRNKEFGIYIDPFNFDKWKEEIEKLLGNKKLRDKIAKDGFKFAKENYDIKKYTEKIEKIYYNNI